MRLFAKIRALLTRLRKRPIEEPAEPVSLISEISKLDSCQQAVIDLPEGIYMVTGAAGTGKSALLYECVRRDLEQGVRPADILCICEPTHPMLRARQAGVSVCTVTEAALRHVAPCGSLFDHERLQAILRTYLPDYRLMHLLEVRKMADDCYSINWGHVCHRFGCDVAKPAGPLSQSRLLDIFDECRLVIPRLAALRYQLIHEHPDALLSWPEAMQWRSRQQWLRAFNAPQGLDPHHPHTPLIHNALSFERYMAEHGLTTSLGLLLRAITDGVNRSYSRVYVDDTESLSPLQLALLKRLRLAQRCRTVYFADPEQAIYGFLGARPDTLKLLATTCDRVLSLSKRHRTEAAVSCHEYTEDEPLTIADKILPQTLPTVDDDTPRITAILAPSNDIVTAISAALTDHKITHFLISDRDFFHSLPFRTLLAHLTLMVRPDDREARAHIYMRALPQCTLLRARQMVTENPYNERVRSFYEPIRAHTEALLDTVTPLAREMERAMHSLRFLLEGEASVKFNLLLQHLDGVLLRGLERQTLRQQLESVLPILATMRERHLCLSPAFRHTLIVSTVHQAKGREYDTVILPSVIPGYYPSSYSRTPEDYAEDARRLHVARTRATRLLHIITRPT